MPSRPDPEETFVQLVVAHQTALRAFVLSLLPGSDEVEDVIQETNAEIWRKRGEFEIGTSFKSWMFSVAKFKVMSSWRDRSRRKEWVVPEETMTKLIEGVETGGYETTEEKQEVLGHCLQQLRPVDRGLILRRYIKGCDLGELAAETGRSKESLKVSLHRLRMMLKACMLRKLKIQEAGS